MYDIRIADTIGDLTKNFTTARQILQSEIITGDLSNPQEFGKNEVFVIKVDIEEGEDTKSYAFAIRAQDDADRLSEVSNVVLATLREYIPPTGGPPQAPGLVLGAIIGIICAAVGGLLLIIIIVALFVKCFCCNWSKKAESTSLKEDKGAKGKAEVHNMYENAGFDKDKP